MHNQLTDVLRLKTAPIAISFVETPPPGVPRIAGGEPAGCGYWRRAAQGEVFYTTADDHKRCPVGAHTHNVPLAPHERDELMALVKTMVGLEYLTMEDVGRIPTRKAPFRFAVYAPLEAAPVAPDIVLVRGNARQLMLLAEAAQAAGVAGSGPTMGRPTCAVLPEATESGRTSASFACIGNRVYTGAGDDEAYFAVPGSALRALEEKLVIVARANDELEKFHRARAGTV
jgi:uncharacterized protein (DUF169 family)